MDDKITINKCSMTGLLVIKKYDDVVELTKENILDLKEYFENLDIETVASGLEFE